MQARSSSRFGFLPLILAVFTVLMPALCVRAHAQDSDSDKAYRGRKYKAPPETSKIEVTVLKGFNKKPIDGAHVIFHPEKDGRDEGYMELKTHQDGKAVIDVIPTGSSVRVQVLADGFATYAEDLVISEPQRAITIEMQRPKAQVSTYVDNGGKASERKPGIQEPVRPKKTAPGAGSSSTTPSSTSQSGTTPSSTSPSSTAPSN
jgi:hypothetical protein